MLKLFTNNLKVLIIQESKVYLFVNLFTCSKSIFIYLKTVNFDIFDFDQLNLLQSQFLKKIQNPIYNFIDTMPKTQLTLLSLYNKIKQIQKKLETVVSRLQACEDKHNEAQKDSINESSVNPLNIYLKNEEGQQFENYQASTYRRKSSEMLLSHSKQKIRNYTDRSYEIPRLQLDSAPFAIVKKSILTNTEEIQKIRERIEEVEKHYIRRIIDVEEGVTILTRLSEMMEKKIDTLTETVPIKDVKIDGRERQDKDNGNIMKIIAKYHNIQQTANSPYSSSYRQ